MGYATKMTKAMSGYWKKIVLQMPATTSTQYKVKQAWWQFLQALNDRSWLKDAFLFLILIFYSVLGAFLFNLIECPTQNSQTLQEKSRREALRDNFTQRLANVLLLLPNETTSIKHLEELLYRYEQDVGAKMDFTETCNFMGSLFYAITIFTTIGYGHKTCVTKWGRTMTIIYAIIGIPLMFALVNGLGKRIFLYARRQWNRARRLAHRIHSRYLKNRDSNSQWPPKCPQSGSAASVRSDTVAPDEMDDVDFPLHLSLGFVVLYLFVCSAIFLLWERSWDYFTAFYFFFISLSTIGFGDVVPDSLGNTLLGFPFYIVGLALVTCCINVLQAKVERSCDVTVEQVYKALEAMLAKMGNEITLSSSMVAESTLVQERVYGEPTVTTTVRNKEEVEEKFVDDEQPINIIEICKSPGKRKITLRKYSCREVLNNFRSTLTKQSSSVSLASEFIQHRLSKRPSVVELCVPENISRNSSGYSSIRIVPSSMLTRSESTREKGEENSNKCNSQSES